MLRQLTIELTNACNSACTFCPHRHSTRPVTHMGMDLYKKIMMECAAMGFATEDIPVGLCGIGEPLLHPRFDQALEIARSQGVPVGVGSNGGLLHEHIDLLVEHAPAQVVFSIDATTAATHAKMRPRLDFDQIVGSVREYLDKVRKAKTQPKDLWIQTLVTKLNRHEVGAFVETWRKRLDGIKGGKVFVKCICPWPYAEANALYPSPVPDIPAEYSGHPRVDIAKFTPPIKYKSSCILFDGFAQVLSDGSYVPCCMPTRDYWGIGNVRDYTIQQLYSSREMDKLRAADKDDIPFCKDCV